LPRDTPMLAIWLWSELAYSGGRVNIIYLRETYITLTVAFGAASLSRSNLWRISPSTNHCGRSRWISFRAGMWASIAVQLSNCIWTAYTRLDKRRAVYHIFVSPPKPSARNIGSKTSIQWGMSRFLHRGRECTHIHQFKYNCSYRLTILSPTHPQQLIL
jgi:hypothetical protein